MKINITPILSEIKYQLRKLRYVSWQSPFVDNIDPVIKNIIESRHKYMYLCDFSPSNVKEQLYEIIVKHDINVIEGAENYYDDELDIVSIMPYEVCKNFDIYQSVLLHESVHWTRTVDRTGRDNKYSKEMCTEDLRSIEECVAELATIILHKTIVQSLDFSITSNSIQYINSHLYGICDTQLGRTKLVNRTIIPLAVEASNFLLAPLDTILEY